jgi:hypothetical protein
MTEQLNIPPATTTIPTTATSPTQNSNGTSIPTPPASPQSPKPDDQTLPTPSGTLTPQQQQLPTWLLPPHLQPAGFFESKIKRIKVLRVLAIKAAAILFWDLVKFEKEFV